MTDVTSPKLIAILGMSLLLSLLPPFSYRQKSSSSHRSPSAEQKSEQRIIREVGHELRMMPQFSIFDNIAYKVTGDTVTLLGQVNHAVLKDDAEKRIKHIEGVDNVVNDIEILPPSFNDDRLRRQLARAIYRSPRLSQYAIQPVPPIHIIVKNGHVWLEGVVRDQGDKNVAGLSANGVPGVFSVENNLQVEKPAPGKK
jgi:hyperosmotically inducible protein